MRVAVRKRRAVRTRMRTRAARRAWWARTQTPRRKVRVPQGPTSRQRRAGTRCSRPVSGWEPLSPKPLGWGRAPETSDLKDSGCAGPGALGHDTKHQ